MNIFKIFSSKQKADERVSEIVSRGGKPTVTETKYNGKKVIIVQNHGPKMK